jgi:hypothetical protein
MTSGITSVSEALELLVPPFEPSAGDWAGIVDRAGEPARRRLLTRRHIVLVGIVLAVAAALVATPAFGIRGLIADLFGRKDVAFTGKTAPVEVKRNFYDLGIGIPESIAPAAIASQSRRVASFKIRGREHVLYVAPTRRGGYCWEFTGSFGGCARDRGLAQPRRVAPGYVHPELFGVTFDEPTTSGVPHVATVSGDIRTANAHSLEIQFADGSKAPLAFYFVSKPIDAGFFYAAIPAGHETKRTRAVAAVIRDRRGKVLARQPFDYPTPQQVARQRARQKAMLQRLHRLRNVPPPIRRSPKLPPPTAPFQRGSDGGVTVVAGHNGVAVFDTTRATPRIRTLISGRGVGYACIRRLPYNPAPVSLSFPRTTFDRVAIRLQGSMSPPFLGCEIQGGYGHSWPDRNGSHSAVEIAFTSAGRSYFEDRAAARDLALFLRSRRMHELRKLQGGGLATALHDRYGSAVTKLDSASATLRPGRIGYVTEGSSTTYVEWSTTGRHFYVRVDAGRIRAQNVKPLAFVF